MERKKSEAADRIGFGTITQVSFVVCSILLFAGIDAASATVITVSGSTSTDIQNAVNKASSGDTVFIPAGWYKYTKQIYIATPNLLIKGVGVDPNNPTPGTYLYTDKVGDSGAIISIRANRKCQEITRKDKKDEKDIGFCDCGGCVVGRGGNGRVHHCHS